MDAPASSPSPPGKSATGALLPDSDNVVTASALVRHFGLWQDRAVHQPVYVLHRGRPRFVLSTVELMQALCTPHPVAQRGDDRAAFDALLARIPQVVLVADAALRIMAMSAAAQAYFAHPDGDGLLLQGLVDGPSFERVADAVGRVVATGHCEDVDAVPARYPSRRLRLLVHPHPMGVAILAADATAVDELAEARAAAMALDEACAACGVVASARIGLRGYVEQAPASLVALTGLSSAALTGARFTTLIDIADRARVGDAIELAIRDGQSVPVSAVLHTRRAGALPVIIGLSAIRVGGAVATIAAMIAGTAGLEPLKAP